MLGGGTAYGGDQYRWVDGSGVLHFSDRLPPPGQDRYTITKENEAGQEVDRNTSAARAGMEALYTKEAYDRIATAGRETADPAPAAAMSAKERYRARIEREREAYRRAGYSYDAVIRAVADDLRNGRIPLSETETDVASRVCLGLNAVRDRAEREGVNCLRFFDRETARAVKYLWEMTRRGTRDMRDGAPGIMGKPAGIQDAPPSDPGTGAGRGDRQARGPEDRQLRSARGKAGRAAGNGTPAPFTVAAGKTIRRSLVNRLNELAGGAGDDGPGNAAPSPTTGARNVIEANRAAYADAGYDFDATIRAVADAFRNNPKPVKEFLNARLPDTPFLHIVQTMGSITVGERVDCSRFFDPETGKAVDCITETLLKMQGRDEAEGSEDGGAARDHNSSAAAVRAR